MEIRTCSKFILQKDQMIVYDGQGDGILVIIPDEGKLKCIEPQGEIKLFWLDRFGVIPSNDFIEATGKIKDKETRKELYEAMKSEFENPEQKQVP